MRADILQSIHPRAVRRKRETDGRNSTVARMSSQVREGAGWRGGPLRCNGRIEVEHHEEEVGRHQQRRSLRPSQTPALLHQIEAACGEDGRVEADPKPQTAIHPSTTEGYGDLSL